MRERERDNQETNGGQKTETGEQEMRDDKRARGCWRG